MAETRNVSLVTECSDCSSLVVGSVVVLEVPIQPTGVGHHTAVALAPGPLPGPASRPSRGGRTVDGWKYFRSTSAQTELRTAATHVEF